MTIPEIFRKEITKPGYQWLRQFYWVGVGGLLCLCYIFSYLVHSFRNRYIIHLIIFALLFFTVVLNKLTSRFPKWLGWLLPVIICLFFWIPQLCIINSLSNSCAYKAIQPILAGYAKPKDLVVCAWEVYLPEFARELPADFRLISFPDTERLAYIDFNGLDKRIRDEQYYRNIEKIMLATLTAGGTIWFVDRLPPLVPHLRSYVQIHPDDDFTYAEFVAMNRLNIWLLDNAEPVGDAQIYPCYYTMMAETRFRAKAQ